jgi:hypothetical protein
MSGQSKNKDLKILQFLYQYRTTGLQIPQLAFLTGRFKSNVHRRLVALVEDGYLNEPKKLKVISGRAPHVYRLTKKALTLLVEERIATEEDLTDRSRIHELSDNHLDHEMMLRDIHFILTAACRDGEVKLDDWREGEKLSFDVMIPDKSGRMIPKKVPPDGFFTLEDLRWPEGKRKRDYFLEADRSTETHAKFAPPKVLGYWYYLTDPARKFQKEFGSEMFRLVVVTKTHARAESLAGLVERLLPERAYKYYLFTSIENFSFENPKPILFDKIYIRPASTDRYVLARAPQP